MMTHIEDQYSNQVLRHGSLFKFIYRLEHDNIWFHVEFKRQQEMRVHFIKSSVWCYKKEMEEKEVYYARDIFNYESVAESDRDKCRTMLKRLFESFESLSFSLLDEKKFFQTDPRHYVYDLFYQVFDASRLPRIKNREFQISKVMVVILSKEDKRSDIGLPSLQYHLSDVKLLRQKSKQYQFSFDDKQDDIYEKLKNISALDHEKIVESEGLPFSYIVNLLREISDIYTSYGQNLVFQVEKVFNDQYKLINSHYEQQQKESPDQQRRGQSPKISIKLFPDSNKKIMGSSKKMQDSAERLPFSGLRIPEEGASP